MTKTDQYLYYWPHYLPYDLQLRVTKNKELWNPGIDEKPLFPGSDATLTPLLYSQLMNGEYVNKFEFEAILRPISDIIKQIDHYGGKFVPIVILNEICNPGKEKSKTKFSISDWGELTGGNEKQYNFDYTINENTTISSVCRFSYWKELQRFTLSNETNSDCYGVPNQLELFQKLFEWGFDVFGINKE